MTEPLQKCLPEQSVAFRSRVVAMHGFHSLWDQVVISITSFAVMAFVGRLGKDEMGVFALGMSTFWLLAGISNALVWIPYTARSAHLKGEHRLQFRGDIAGVNLVIAAILAIAILLIAGVVKLSMPSSTWLVSFFLFFSPMVFTLTLREHARRIFIADFEGKRLLALDVPISILMLCAVAILYVSDQLDANLAMLVTAAAALPALYVTVRHINKASTSLRSIGRVVISNWPYGKWLVVVAVAWISSDGLLRWMLVGLKGQQALGAFAGASLVVSLVNPVLLAMTSFARSVASLKLATGSQLSLTTATIASVRRLSIFSILAFVALHFGGDSVMVLVLGPSYSNPGLVSILALAVCMEAVIVPVEATFVALEYGRLLSLVAVARLLISILIGIILIPTFGVWGVAVAMLCRSAIVSILYGFSLWIIHGRFGDDAKSQELSVSGSDTVSSVEPTEHCSAPNKIVAL